jgi:hypothetical protein
MVKWDDIEGHLKAFRGVPYGWLTKDQANEVNGNEQTYVDFNYFHTDHHHS